MKREPDYDRDRTLHDVSASLSTVASAFVAAYRNMEREQGIQDSLDIAKLIYERVKDKLGLTGEENQSEAFWCEVVVQHARHILEVMEA